MLIRGSNHGLRQAKIHELDDANFRNENIRWLNISVKNSMRMSERQAVQKLLEIVKSFLDIDPSSRSNVRLKNILKALTLDVLHDKKPFAFFIKGFVHLNNILVATKGFNLPSLRQQRVEFSSPKIFHALYGDIAAHLFVRCMPDDSVAAVSEKPRHDVTVL